VKDYEVRLPIIVSYETECSRPFEHNLLLKVSARNPQEAVKKLEDLLSASLSKKEDAINA
jgi:hypothetical protein